MDALLRAGSGLPALRNLYQRVGWLKELEVGHRFNNGHFPPDRVITTTPPFLVFHPPLALQFRGPVRPSGEPLADQYHFLFKDENVGTEKISLAETTSVKTSSFPHLHHVKNGVTKWCKEINTDKSFSPLRSSGIPTLHVFFKKQPPKR
ncbi:hypothetical protein CDAR_470951 [Caerostris darwini]|uniref:Uncharacterized protein n=1 Tax=Caerostris darwini TaxID=1538125 RepID=A0AAV4W8J7_9ARAC|nr:hypothetical protein CDAR_470951 [Caerostris darwini]